MASKKSPVAGGDAPGDRRDDKKKKEEKKKEDATVQKDDKKKEGGKSEKFKSNYVLEDLHEPEDLPKTASQIAREEAEYRSRLRKQRFKRRWPEITKVKINTRPWYPPPPPRRPPPVEIELPELTTRRWVPPWRRRRRLRPRKVRIPPEQMMQQLPEPHHLKKIWHNFNQVTKNKMMLQGSIACNSKRYSPIICGAQTGCIAVVCRALLDEKTPAELVHTDVDDVIENGDRYYKSCRHALKCYKGNPHLQLNQLLTSFFLHDVKYTIKTVEVDKGILIKSPDSLQSESDLMTLMQKRIGSTYMMILSIGDTRHFLIWGHPPAPEAGSACKTVCYLFDPHMLDEAGEVDKLTGAGAFLRYAGVNSFVVDFLSNYGELNAPKSIPKPSITLTNIEIVQKEPLIRDADYGLELKALTHHCFSEWDSRNINALLDKKLYHHKYPLASLSMVSLATSRANSKKKVKDFYQKAPKELPPVVMPVMPEKGPPNPTVEQIMSLRGEDFFLNCPKLDAHSYGRDDLVPLPKSETVLHSPVEVANKNFSSQYRQLDVERWILRGTRHMASHRYQIFKHFTGVACCVAALAMLQRYRARAWNEDTFDETLDVGYNLFRESLVERGGPVRRLVLGELKDNFRIRDKEYNHKERNIAVWGKLLSSNPKVFDLCRGIEAFFKEADSGILQIPGEFEVAIWNEGGKYYIYHPWPADRYGYRVGLRDGGKGCILYFSRIPRLCEHFMESVADMKKKPYSISDVMVTERKKELPEPLNNMKPVAPGRWIVRGSFHEADARFPEEHRGRQATPASITAVALAHVVDPGDWTSEDIDETLVRGDILYQNTIEHLEKMGIGLDSPHKSGEETSEEEESSSSGNLSPADVMNRFKVSDFDCIETDHMDTVYAGNLKPPPGSNVPNLKNALKTFFKEYTHGVFTARGYSTAIWKHDGYFYFYDPHACDENGLPSDEPRASACLVRIKGNIGELAEILVGNLPPGSDDHFSISPITITATKLNTEIGAPETKLESKAFEWIKKGTHAIMMGPRGENSAIGKAADKAGIDKDDLAGRTLALPAAAAFVAATGTVPPPHMHQDHMYNFLDAGKEYYLNHLKKTGRTDIKPEDLTEKFEMGVNTFSIALEEPVRLPLRLPDEPPPEGEEGGGGTGLMEEEEPETMKEMKDLLFKMWYDQTKPTSVALLVNDYYQLGLWMQPGGKVVAFDPAPTLIKGVLPSARIRKGDELRLQRIKDETISEDAGEADEDDEMGGEGEEKPEPEPEVVPPESCPVLIVAASPGEFIDKLVQQGGLDKKQAIGPAWLYPAKVTNELTSVLKEKKGDDKKDDGGEEGDHEESLVPPLEDSAMGKYFERLSRTTASVRGRVAQGENYFMDKPNRNNQDAANSVMGIVVEHIEPHMHWKPELIDSILKYGDRLYTMSAPKARSLPYIRPSEIIREFHVTNFNVRLDIEGDVVTGDVKAGEGAGVYSLTKGIKKFFEEHRHGVICAKNYCVGIWKGVDENSWMLWEPHAVGPTGKTSPAGAASAVLFSTIGELAEIFKSNIEGLGVDRPGNNNFSISAVKVFWEFSRTPDQVTAQGAVPDEGYEWKVLTAYVETARGRTILRGSRPPDLVKFSRDTLLQSSCGAIVAASMSQIRRPPLWTRRTVDEVMNAAGQLFISSLGSLGYEFRPGEDVLLPLQVVKRFILGVNYVRYDLMEVFSGKLEQKDPSTITMRSALERFFEMHTHGILWSTPHAVAVWRVSGAPSFYMMDPHACGPTGLRMDGADDGAACVLTFTSAKLMAYAYLQNIPSEDRPRHDFQLYAMSIAITPLKRYDGEDPPLIRQGIGPSGRILVPATSKVNVDGSKRVADNQQRVHPPGSATCLDAQRATEMADKEKTRLKGRRNASGWLVLADGTQFMSACHSIACKKFPYASRGNQALAVSVMAIAMSRVQDLCRWCSGTLDEILESGDQLYQDSYLHFRPKSSILNIEQILRKFYAPGNCVCRVVVYSSRHGGSVASSLLEQVTAFFREEKSGVFVAGNGDFAVALFRSPRGYYMFDPMDRDRYGRAVAPPCRGKARACFSQYATVQDLCEKLGPNIPPVLVEVDDATAGEAKPKQDPVEGTSKSPKEKLEEEIGVHFEEPAQFAIYGVEVTRLRRLNRHER